jgi:hypothetical protein
MKRAGIHTARAFAFIVLLVLTPVATGLHRLLQRMTRLHDGAETALILENAYAKALRRAQRQRKGVR